VKFSYCYELRDTGKHGFVLPANQIIPTGTEMFVAVKSMADDIMEYYNITSGETNENIKLIETRAAGQY
jgi:hypothetical protein